ncbi:hypothetical protein TorRG33x02_079460, partial [Trema orientale]
GPVWLAVRLGKRRARLRPEEGLPPLGLVDPDFLLPLMISSRDMLRGSDIFGFEFERWSSSLGKGGRELGFHREGSREEEEGKGVNVKVTTDRVFAVATEPKSARRNLRRLTPSMAPRGLRRPKPLMEFPL